VRADRRALYQIILNLANNAIKDTKRGSVRVELMQRTAKDGTACVDVNVTDTGHRHQAGRSAAAFSSLRTSRPVEHAAL
jgi:protein-histidine pros-kinase